MLDQAIEEVGKLPTSDGYIDTHLREPLVEENAFVRMSPEVVPPPSFEDAWDSLPQPFWEGHEGEIDCYRGAWELAFANVRRPEPESGFVAALSTRPSTTACSCGTRRSSCCSPVTAAAPSTSSAPWITSTPASTPTGYLPGDRHLDGKDRFERFDAASTGPNVMPWTEWEHYGDTADSDRLGRVFPILVSYHRWLRRHRTWRDGTYWTSGLGSGMDNQPRFPQKQAGEGGWPERLTYHGHAVWIDACLQQILSADLLLRMADALDRSGEVADLREERDSLSLTVNERLWNDESAFYHDELADGTLSDVQTIGAFWALLGRRGAAGEFLSVRRTPWGPEKVRATPSVHRSPPTTRSTIQAAATGSVAYGRPRTTWSCADSTVPAITTWRMRSPAKTSTTW